MKRVGSIRELKLFVRDWCWSVLVGVFASHLLFLHLRKAPSSPARPPPAPRPPTDQVDALRYAAAADTREQLRQQLEQLFGRQVRLLDFPDRAECPCPKCTERRNSRRPN